MKIRGYTAPPKTEKGKALCTDWKEKIQSHNSAVV